MGRRTRTLVAVAAVALAMATSCSTTEEGVPSAAGSGGDADTITSADEVIKVVDKGFVSYRVERSSGYNSDHLSYGFVIENVSDMVALSVRVEVDFTDKAGNPADASGGNDFTVLLPGQRMGAGGNKRYDGKPVGDMDVRVTLIGSLDTPDGERHRDPPAPYAELRTSNPVVKRTGSNDTRESTTLEVTNTYDVPLTPKATAVVWDAKGIVVGGMGNNSMDKEIQPGASGQARLNRDVHLPRLTEGKTEYYADPVLGWLVSRDPVWQDF